MVAAAVFDCLYIIAAAVFVVFVTFSEADYTVFLYVAIINVQAMAVVATDIPASSLATFFDFTLPTSSAHTAFGKLIPVAAASFMAETLLTFFSPVLLWVGAFLVFALWRIRCSPGAQHTADIYRKTVVCVTLTLTPFMAGLLRCVSVLFSSH